MIKLNFDPKEKPGKNDDPEKRKKQEETENEETEEFPDLFEEKDEDFNDPDEQEFI
jgi:hypothetical protein